MSQKVDFQNMSRWHPDRPWNALPKLPPNRVYEILSRKRPLTLAMIRALHEQLGIPSELLIREPAAGYRVAKCSKKSRR